MQFLTADQKQQHVNICKELCQIAPNDTAFLSRVVTRMRAGFTVMTLRQSDNPPNGKMKSKVKGMLIIFFDIKGIVHKEFLPAGRTVNSAYHCE
jgi:hypothetical protein